MDLGANSLEDGSNWHRQHGWKTCTSSETFCRQRPKCVIWGKTRAIKQKCHCLIVGLCCCHLCSASSSFPIRPLSKGCSTMSKQSKMLERIQYTGWMLVTKDAGPVCVATESLISREVTQQPSWPCMATSGHRTLDPSYTWTAGTWEPVVLCPYT